MRRSSRFAGISGTRGTRGTSGATLSIVLAASLLAAACGDDGTQPSTPPAVVASVEVLPADRSLAVGEELPYAARALDATGKVITGRAVTWKSSNETIASVTATGVVSAVAPGNVAIRATVDGRAGSGQLLVTLAPVAQVEVNPTAVSLVEGEARTVFAVARDGGGRVLEGRTIAWVSDDPTVAEVDATGRIVARRPGTIVVTATVEGRSASVTVEVKPIPVASVAVRPTALVLDVGETEQLQAIIRDAGGNALANRAVIWTTDNANATVSATGLVTAASPGYVTITATSEGKTFSVAATVVAEEEYDYELLYTRNRSATVNEIFILSLAYGSVPLRLNAGNVSRSPTASPDGSRIAFAVSMIDLGTGQQVDDIFAVDRTGLNMRRLTSAAGYDDQPAWSPVAAKIAYAHYDMNGRSDIWVMNAEGSNPVNLTADLPATTRSSSPAWSADGTRIAFSSMENGATGSTSSIWTMRADGADKRRLTSTLAGFDAMPNWSPDGQSVAFVRYYGDETDITMVGAAGGQPTRLALPGRQTAPAWSPDGRLIAFAQDGAPFSRIFTMRPDGTDVRLRTGNPTWGGGMRPTWIRKP